MRVNEHKSRVQRELRRFIFMYLLNFEIVMLSRVIFVPWYNLNTSYEHVARVQLTICVG